MADTTDTTAAPHAARCPICKQTPRPGAAHQHSFRMASKEGAPFSAVIDASDARTSEELALLLSRVRAEMRQYVTRSSVIDIMPSRYELFRGGDKMTVEFDRARPIEFVAIEA